MKSTKKSWILLIVIGLILVAVGVVLIRGKLVTSEPALSLIKVIAALGAIAFVVSVIVLASRRFSTGAIFIACVIVTAALFALSISIDGGKTTETAYYLLGGVGGSMIMMNLGPLYNAKHMKDRRYAKQVDIMEKDERNKTIRLNAKAKTCNLTVVILGLLTICLPILKADILIILISVAADISVMVTNAYYLKKFEKEM